MKKRYPKIKGVFNSFDKMIDNIINGDHVGIVINNVYKVYITEEITAIEDISDDKVVKFVHRDDDNIHLYINQYNFKCYRFIELDNYKYRDINFIKQQKLQTKGVNRL